MSSSDEGVPDVLHIKPPQPRGIRDRLGHREERRADGGSRDRESRSLSSKGQYRDRGDGGSGRHQVPSNRKRDNFQPQQQHGQHRDRSDRGHEKRVRRNPRERRHLDDTGAERVQKKRHEEFEQEPRRNVTDGSAPGFSRDFEKGHERRADHGRSRDERSKQLRKSTLKRKHLEEQEERALRQIEERRHREKRGEPRRHSGGKKRRLKSETVVEHKSDDDHEEGKVEEQAEPSLEVEPTEDDEQDVDGIPIVEDIDKSSSELEEGEEVEEAQALPYHSDVSSESDEEEKKETDLPAKGTNDEGKGSSRSEDSQSSSSKSDTASDDSSSSGAEENSGQERRNGEKGENGKKRNEGTRQKSPEAKVSRESYLPDIEVIETEKKPEVKPPDESLLTEVDRAIQQVNLLPPYFPAVQGCRRVEEFSLLNRIEEGTYGVVYRAKDKRTNEIVALKRLKMEKERDGFPITSLREINTLLKAQHENIVTCREIVVGSNTDKIFLVMDYVEHDLKALMETLRQKDQKFIMGEVKCLILQLLRAVAHLHDNWILHRDLKTSNLLLSHKGILKVGDFGLAREYGSPLKGYTPIVVTLWYRAPELLLGVKEYSTPIDVWSVGCIFGELLKMEPMFPGKSEANQLNLIFQTLGTPNDRIWPGYSKLPLLQKMTFVEQPMNKLKTRFGISDLGIDLMNKFLTYNPAKRITAEDALRHGFFKEAPLPIDPSVFPTWPAKSELGHKKAPSSPKPPSGGGQFKELKEDDDPSGFFLGIGDRRPPIGAGFSLKF